MNNIFKALGDPTRLEIVRLLRDKSRTRVAPRPNCSNTWTSHSRTCHTTWIS